MLQCDEVRELLYRDSGNARRPHRKVKYEGIEVLRVLLAKSKEHGVLVPGRSLFLLLLFHRP